MKNYIGLDYGHGLTNFDTKTGIHYGALPFYLVHDFWCGESEPHYTILCEHCSKEISFDNSICPHCNLSIDNENDFLEPNFFCIKNAEYFATQNSDSQDIIIEKSPYYTLCNFASPCFPGGGYIPGQNKSGIKTFCFHPDCFEENIEIEVFKVSNNKLIKRNIVL